MPSNRLISLPLALLVLVLGACGQPEDTRPGQPVKKRQDAFHQLLRSFEPMGKMLRENRYDAERFNALVQEFSAKREAPWTLFPPDTLYPPSKAKAEVWEQPEVFAKARDEFLKKSADFLVVAQGKDPAAIKTSYQAVYDSCQSCHEKFRKR